MRVLILGAALSAVAVPTFAAEFMLASTEVKSGSPMGIAQVYTACKGQNISPALSWSGEPSGTQSFAVTMYDLDARGGSGWWHWIVYNIPASQNSLPAGAGDPKKSLLPAGALQGRTDFGTPGYGGPCPPPGKPHHYHLRLYALKVDRLDVPADATAAYIGFNVHAQMLGEAQLMGVYGR